MNEIRASKIWHNGELVDWDKAQVHVLSHALHYGSSWFEGIRCYDTRRGPEVFRLQDHTRRLIESCRIYRTQPPFSSQEFDEAVLETIRANDLRQCYIRPLVLRGLGSIGVNPLGTSVECFVIVWEWGRYLGEEAMESGVDVCVSSWTRPAANTFPTMAKAAGNYLNSILIKMEAEANGYVEGIALTPQGYVSEGSGENLFLVKDGVLYTTPLEQAILPGITRLAVMTLAQDLGYRIVERVVAREMLYTADELFFTGTATEVAPIRSVDRIQVGQGSRGPVTASLQSALSEILQGKVEDRHGWMTPVHSKIGAAP